MLEPIPSKRFSIEEVLNHTYFHEHDKSYFELTQLHREALKRLAELELEYKRAQAKSYHI